MKRFSLPIPFAWRDPKSLPIPTHAELVEKVAVLMERVASQSDGWLLPHCAIPVIPVAPFSEGGQR